jgi:hypothetical protein
MSDPEMQNPGQASMNLGDAFPYISLRGLSRIQQRLSLGRARFSDTPAERRRELRQFLESTGPRSSNVSMAHRLLRTARSPRNIEEGKLNMMPERMHTIDEMIMRVQGEFLEMPGLRLTEPQARRLWGLDAVSCNALLGALIEAKFLFRTRDGAIMRVEHAEPVKAALRPRQSIAVA